MVITFQQLLREFERVVFPGFSHYHSMGAVIRSGICAVCDQPFHSCDHLEGKIYSGRYCMRIHFEVV